MFYHPPYRHSISEEEKRDETRKESKNSAREKKKFYIINTTSKDIIAGNGRGKIIFEGFLSLFS